jgi:hypothetical protein
MKDAPLKKSWKWSLDGLSPKPPKMWRAHLVPRYGGDRVRTPCGLISMRSRAKIAGHAVCKKCTAFAEKHNIALPEV